VTLPATATAISVTFFLHITTEEQTTTQAFDKQRLAGTRKANTRYGRYSREHGH